MKFVDCCSVVERQNNVFMDELVNIKEELVNIKENMRDRRTDVQGFVRERAEKFNQTLTDEVEDFPLRSYEDLMAMEKGEHGVQARSKLVILYVVSSCANYVFLFQNT